MKNDKYSFCKQIESKNLIINASIKADSEILDEFYYSYDRSFILDNEKEELIGFKKCLALNQEPDHSKLVKKFGDFKEVVLLVKNHNNDIIGSANFLCFVYDEENTIMNLNYIYVTPEFRGQGYFKGNYSVC
jgi:hypothetical protein